ncbi:unnamed protein product [Mytilus coruscus]|uniref:Uncharacterized protein n=1 Tax=Mytilus coruscus TaxID=42192 RepID=A0A6J8BRG4_MYTCO|nr:unnamed protein product [Mytilus coruscus]
MRRRRTLCQIPSLVSSHPDVDHTISEQDGRVQNPRLLKNRKSASRGLKAADVLHLIRTSGMTLPVNSHEVVLYNEQESSAPKKQKLNCSNYPSNSIQRNATSEDMDTLDEEICLPSQSTDLESETTCISESSQDLSQNSSEATHTFRIDTLNHYLEAINLPNIFFWREKPWDRYVKSAKSGYCDSTMYRIIAQCGAKVRTSLEGIDYFVAEGSLAFSTLSNILEELVQIEV